jgi:hypothetical protein
VIVNKEDDQKHPSSDPPKPSKGFKGKLPKRQLSQKKGARRSKQHDVPQEEAADDATVAPSALDEDVGGQTSPATLSSSTSSLRPQIESRGAKRKISTAEFESELKRVYPELCELDESRAALQLKDSENTALKKRNTTLVAQVASASDAVRASRNVAQEAQTSAQASTKEAGSEADKLSCLLERAEADLADVRRQLETKEMEMKQQSSQHKTKLDEAIRKSVDEAKEKAEVRIILLFISLTNINISFIANSFHSSLFPAKGCKTKAC